MQSIFISSIEEGYEDIRATVRRVVESLGMRPLMAELAGARPESPQRALLDLVAEADVFLLLVAPRYSAPTEDEYDEARRLGKPILVLKQETERDPEQEAFLGRVAGGWVGGRLWGKFMDANDVWAAAVRALSGLAAGERGAELTPVAQERAHELARGERAQGSWGRRSIARVALVPVVGGPILDAVALDQPELGDTVSDLVRSARLVPHSVGVAATVTRQGVSVRRVSSSYGDQAEMITVGADGAVVCEVEVAGDDQLSGMRVDPELLTACIGDAGKFALSIWERIDSREEVQQIAVAVAIPDAQHKIFGLPVNAGSFSMGSNMPATVLVPEPAAIVRRAAVASDDLVKRLVAEVRRVFADAGAVAR